MDTRFIVERTHYFAPEIDVIMIVTIKGSPTDKDLINAIIKATKKHEMFRSKVYLDKNGESFYTLGSKNNYKIEIRDAAREDDWKQIIYEQQRIPFNVENGDMIRFILLNNSINTKLFIVAHHLVGDGLAITYLIRDIMSALANPDIRYNPLPIRVFENKCFPKDSSLNPLVLYITKILNKKWNKNRKIFHYNEFLAMFHSYWNSRQNEVLEGVISGSKLNTLIQQCKEHSVTVNSAIVTAFLLAVKIEKDIGMAVSVRPEGYEGMGNYASGISIRYKPDPKKSFWENAKLVHKRIYKKLNNNHRKYFLLKFLSSLDPTLVDATHFSTFGGFEHKVANKAKDIFGYSEKANGFSITNLTKLKIPVNYGAYSIDNIYFIPPLIANTKRVFGVVTINNKMNITLQYEKKAEFEKTETSFNEAMKLLCSDKL